MPEAGLKKRIADLAGTRGAAIFLSLAYPTAFALSNNWYTIGSRKITWLVAVAVGLAAALVALLWLIDKLVARLLPRAAAQAWSAHVAPVVVALTCAGLLGSLLWGTLEATFGGRVAAICAALAATLAILWAFLSGRVRYFNAAAGLFTAMSLFTWSYSYAEVRLLAPSAPEQLTQKSVSSVKLVDRPNIYLFIFDAYGSRDAYRRVFEFDNSAHYQALEQLKFKVVHGFSNYYATWPTTLGIFLGAHHYYRISSGVEDSKLGRLIMAGLARNPVLEALRTNGYRTQYISAIDYFVNERGVLDYVFPEEPLNSALRVFGSPVISYVFGERSIVAGTRSLEEELAVLGQRMPGTPTATSAPWFTFSHIALPSHSPTGTDWLQLKGFEEQFRTRTLEANRVMLNVIDRIKRKDPGAVIVILGDHGGWRYRRIWGKSKDPNEAFANAGIAPEVVTLDLFGTMLAIDTGGRCDEVVYPTVTPTNIMRVLFACLSNDSALLSGKVDDISLYANSKNQLWVTARDGEPGPSWKPYARPD